MAFPNLQNAPYLLLTTFRKTGEPVATPVWFAQEGDHLYVVSDASAGKLKRLRHTARVTVAPCTFGGQVTGETIEASARILSDTDAPHASRVMNRKYPFQKRFTDVVDFFRRHKGVYVQIDAVNVE